VAKRRDFLDEIVDERSKQNPEFLDLAQAALERRAACPERAVAGHPGGRPIQGGSARSATDEPASRRCLGAGALEER
jgi:hypothetical protein